MPRQQILLVLRFAGDKMAAAAIPDRLFHKAHIFNIDGHSYGLKDFNQALWQDHMRRMSGKERKIIGRNFRFAFGPKSPAATQNQPHP